MEEWKTILNKLKTDSKIVWKINTKTQRLLKKTKKKLDDMNKEKEV